MDYAKASVSDRAAMIRRGIWSQEEFKVARDDEEAVIKAVTYENKDARLAAIWFPETTHLGVQETFLSLSDSSTTCSGLVLDGLPQELIDSMLYRLDMVSLFRMRHVNRRLRNSVNSLHRYRDIVRYGGFDVTLALLRSNVGLYIGLDDMYTVLCTRNCMICNNCFGDFVFFLGCLRCCKSCLHSASETRVRSLNYARGVYGGLLSNKQLDSFPKMAVLPGLYGPEEQPITGKESETPVLVSASALTEALHGELTRWGISWYSSGPGVSRTNGEWEGYTPMAACLLPWLDKDSGVAEVQVRCTGCAWVGDEASGLDSTGNLSPDDLYLSFSRRDFLNEHFKRCEQAQRLWLSTRGGKQEPTFAVALEATPPDQSSRLLIAKALPSLAKGGEYGSQTHRSMVDRCQCTCVEVESSTPEELVACWLRWQKRDAEA
ncbi:hypothetical protein MCOR02_012184 [Pyricularia oryzae]|nr:hypothetical protein MCOR01_003751 [Pyricularia oryzae]KAH9427278.1 hypothetical protein MCOR02_012184 [Pyricularia oryzae]KAI6327807.1 hypothetical protein MCOR34_000309 [Pyricularia oryzae]KAI6472178.1 hypothetical protein MCOR17_002963 [Pyricularia oryzae]KAI6487809.1 hypothetical protein MCOR13_009144 [Pyricularia oryzae]